MVCVDFIVRGVGLVKCEQNEYFELSKKNLNCPTSEDFQFEETTKPDKFSRKEEHISHIQNTT